MKKPTYILNHYGKGVAVILAENDLELKEKLKTAIQEEAVAETDGQFSLEIGEMGDWGEDTEIKTSYVNDGALIEDNDFTLVKTVSY
ncbi:MAG: hypothetical protein AABY15_06835 [Nanoarchaeota archaeon]